MIPFFSDLVCCVFREEVIVTGCTCPTVFAPRSSKDFSVGFPSLRNYCAYKSSLRSNVRVTRSTLTLILCKCRGSKHGVPTPSTPSRVALSSGSFVGCVTYSAVTCHGVCGGGTIGGALAVPR